MSNAKIMAAELRSGNPTAITAAAELLEAQETSIATLEGHLDRANKGRQSLRDGISTQRKVIIMELSQLLQQKVAVWPPDFVQALTDIINTEIPQ